MTLSATASSGLPVSFSSVTTGVCTVSGNTFTIITAGTCTINADQSGDLNYNAAAQIQRSFNVVDPDDVDGDGMPNDWETANGLNPNDPDDALGDMDGDGFTELSEYTAGTDPRNPDDFPGSGYDGDGDGVSNEDEHTARTDPNVDDYPPVITVGGELVINSTGYLTPVSPGSIVTATDGLDGKVTPVLVLAEGDLNGFRPGVHTISWTAYDDAGNKATAVTQTLNVLPQVNFSQDQTVAEGNAVTVKVLLNGDALTYPVSVPYFVNVSSTATVIDGDHNLADGTVEITSGHEAFINFSTFVDSISDDGEKIVITMGVPTNGTKGNKNIHTTTIREGNLSPVVSLSATQGGKPVTTIYKDGGDVKISYTLSDPNEGDSHTFDWSESDSSLVNYVVVAGGLNFPYGVAVDSSGNIYIANTGRHRILKVDTAGVTTTVAVAVSGGLNSPYGVAVDSSGNIYIADTFNNRIIKVDTAGVSTTVAGGLNLPHGVAVDSSGNIYIADTRNNRIIKLSGDFTGCPRIQKGPNLGGGQTLPEGEFVDSRGILESFFICSKNLNLFSDSLFTFDPSLLDPGIYSVSLSVSDNGSPSLSDSAELKLRVVETAPTLDSAQDTDGDGIMDSVEGAGDSDGDGIPDYLDAIDGGSALQGEGANSTTHVLEAEPGLTLKLGSTALSSNKGGAGLSSDDITTKDTVTNVGGYFDFNVSGLPSAGQSVKIVLPQKAAIPAAAVYRKLIRGRWIDFVKDDNNSIASAAGKEGSCPSPGDSAYINGLTTGDWCVQLTIQDGGSNDQDGEANRRVSDPGGVASLPAASSSDGGGGGCFIATAAFGSYLAPDVMVLRHFRDNYLLTNAPGQMFVQLYYEYSPPLADYIAEHENLRTVTRWGLSPLIYGVKYPGMALFSLFISIAGMTFYLKRRAREKSNFQCGSS